MTEEIRSESLMNFKDRFREFLPVVVDVETAGLEPETDAILEVSMMTLKIDEKEDLFLMSSFQLISGHFLVLRSRRPTSIF